MRKENSRRLLLLGGSSGGKEEENEAKITHEEKIRSRFGGFRADFITCTKMLRLRPRLALSLAARTGPGPAVGLRACPTRSPFLRSFVTHKKIQYGEAFDAESKCVTLPLKVKALSAGAAVSPSLLRAVLTPRNPFAFDSFWLPLLLCCCCSGAALVLVLMTMLK